MDKYTLEQFADSLRETYPITDDQAFAYLLGQLDATIVITDKLEEVDRDARS